MQMQTKHLLIYDYNLALGVRKIARFGYENRACTVTSATISITDPIYGCTDPTATNYYAGAQCDDGSCTFCTYGCMDPLAINYDPNATSGDPKALCEYKETINLNKNILKTIYLTNNHQYLQNLLLYKITKSHFKILIFYIQLYQFVLYILLKLRLLQLIFHYLLLQISYCTKIFFWTNCY